MTFNGVESSQGNGSSYLSSSPTSDPGSAQSQTKLIDGNAGVIRSSPSYSQTSLRQAQMGPNSSLRIDVESDHVNRNVNFVVNPLQFTKNRLSFFLSLWEDRTFRIKVYKTLLYICLWYTFSLTLSVFNKWLFSKDEYDFHYPLFTTMVQMWLQFAISVLLVYVFIPRLKPTKYPSLKEYATWFAPCGIATGMDIGLSNKSLQLVTLSFYTMVKSGSPVFVLLFAFLFKLEQPRVKLVLVIGIICFGVVLMVLNETQFNLVGYVQVQVATVLSGFRWSLTQILLSKVTLGSKNPIVTNLYLSPIMAFTMMVVCFAIEDVPSILESKWFDGILSTLKIISLIFAGGIVAFMMTISEYQLISTTSVVTMSIAGIFKEILTMVISVAVFGDKFTVNKIIGLVISLVGIAAYNYIRIMDMRSHSEESMDPEIVINTPIVIFGPADSSDDLLFTSDAEMFRNAHAHLESNNNNNEIFNHEKYLFTEEEDIGTMEMDDRNQSYRINGSNDQEQAFINNNSRTRRTTEEPASRLRSKIMGKLKGSPSGKYVHLPGEEEDMADTNLGSDV